MSLSTEELERLAASRKSCMFFRMRRTSRAITNLYDAALKPVGLRATQFGVLTAVVNHPEAVPMQRLALMLAVDRTTLTRLLVPLEKGGLITVATGEDHRVRLVSMTPAGRDLLHRALPLWEGAQQRVRSMVGDERADNLLSELMWVEKQLPRT